MFPRCRDNGPMVDRQEAWRQAGEPSEELDGDFVARGDQSPDIFECRDAE